MDGDMVVDSGGGSPLYGQGAVPGSRGHNAMDRTLPCSGIPGRCTTAPVSASISTDAPTFGFDGSAGSNLYVLSPGPPLGRFGSRGISCGNAPKPSLGSSTVRSIQRQSCVPGGGVAYGSQVPTVAIVPGPLTSPGTDVAVSARVTAWSSLWPEAKTSAPATAV